MTTATDDLIKQITDLTSELAEARLKLSNQWRELQDRNARISRLEQQQAPTERQLEAARTAIRKIAAIRHRDVVTGWSTHKRWTDLCAAIDEAMEMEPTP